VNLPFGVLRDRLSELLDVDLTGIDEATPLDAVALGPHRRYLLWRLLDGLSGGQVTQEALASSETFGDLRHWCEIGAARWDETERAAAS
jgi:hypothetical protein